ncbi:MAG: 50S ribosome-binding GTPase, partial [Muribaculaceae bacterium]|nr:50S ribosome-binding GTPase [Muribaculaceae bacterium]
MRLSDLKTGETGVIVKILGHGSFRKRVMEMGFVKGRPVTTVLYAPLLDPIKYSIMGYEVSLRRSEAHLIEIVRIDDSDIPVLKSSGTMAETTSFLEGFTKEARKKINVVLIGNPNCGKTSLFNIASGSREHVGNYSGVTVDAKAAHFDYNGYRFNIVDLPGTYSLASHSPEELYVRKYLREETPDVIVNVVDASNLERNLYLTTELIDTDLRMVIALNMYDELERYGTKLDYGLLGEMIGVP